MAKKRKSEASGALGVVISFLVWLTGVIVSLAVAFGMIDGVLRVVWIPLGVTVFFGWVVVVTTLLGVLLSIAHKLR
jgi:hypothetical protein